MDHKFWHQRWQQQQIGFHRDAFHELLTSYFPKISPSGCVFVPLCGKSKDMLWLLDQGYHVLGVELSELAVKAFFAENQMTPTVTKLGDFIEYSAGELRIWVGDVFDLRPNDLAAVDAWYDRAALIALPKSMRQRYAKLVRECLPRGTKGLVITVDYPEGLREGPPFAVAEEEFCSLFSERFRIQQLAHVQGFVEKPTDKTSAMSEYAYLVYD